MYVGVMFVWDVCYDRDHIVPLLLLDILRGRKVGEEEGEEAESRGLLYVHRASRWRDEQGSERAIRWR